MNGIDLSESCPRPPPVLVVIIAQDVKEILVGINFANFCLPQLGYQSHEWNAEQ
jgi:hypothetical protein